jgi:acyl-CoA synthetase (AMP-forming)/AMP-acid ligase II
LSARLPAASIAHLLRETQTSTVLTSTQLARIAEEARTLFLADDNVEFIHAPTFFDLDQQRRDLSMIPHAYSDYGRDDLDAIILHTSGTTGLPKPIYHAQAYILLYATCHRLPPQREPFGFNVSTLPLYHVRAFNP